MPDTPSETNSSEPTISATGGDGVNPRDAGAAFLRQGKYAEAVTSLDAAVAADPDDEAAWRLLGGALSSAGQHDRAVEAFRQALDLLPLAAKNHYNLGIALEGAGNIADAREAFRKALELDPGYEQASARLSALNQRTGAAAMPQPIGATAASSESPAMAASPMSSGLNAVGGLSAVGGATYAPEDAASQGHTNIGGGTGMSQGMGSIGGGTPTLRSPVVDAPTGPPLYGGGGVGAYAPNPVLGTVYGNAGNTSGMQGDVPAEIRGGFNWGAFIFTWIWLFNHGLRNYAWGMLALNFVSRALRQMPDGIAKTLITLAIGGVQIFVVFYLGFQGNKLAWQNRRFDSVDDFKACQRTWAWWALGVFLLMSAIVVIIVIAAAGVASSALRGLSR